MANQDLYSRIVSLYQNKPHLLVALYKKRTVILDVLLYMVKLLLLGDLPRVQCPCGR